VINITKIARIVSNNTFSWLFTWPSIICTFYSVRGNSLQTAQKNILMLSL